VHYNDAGELRRLELPGVHALQFYYADELLLRVDRCVSDPDTPERQWQQHVLMRYHYNDQLQLIAAENALGECERYRYDEQHVIQERRLAGGVQFFWEWEGAGKSARCIHHWSPQSGFDARYQWQDDAFGRRIQKTVTDKENTKPKKTTFLWQANRLIAETDNQTHYRSFIYEPGSYKPLVQLEGKGKTAQVYYYHLDHLGTPQELTSPHGKLVWAVQYRAYGNVVRTIANEIDTPLRFQGQYFDAESGLHYNRHRYYQPDSGRFLTPDPIKLAGGLNNYQYVPNPVNWVDPLGLAGVKGDCPPNGTGNASIHTDVEPSIPDVNEETTRVRHYTNRKGSKGIEESGTINAHDNNRVYVEQAKNKPLNQKEAENTYQIGQGRGRDYIEFDVPTSQLEWIKNPRYGKLELTIKGHIPLKNSKFVRRK
jgi:RHS repeat-associated protein